MIVDEVKAEGRFSIIETCAVDDDQAENPFIEVGSGSARKTSQMREKTKSRRGTHQKLF